MFARTALLAGLALGLIAPVFAAGDPPADLAKAFADADRLEFGPLALDKLAAEDAITDKITGLPHRIAVGHDVATDAKSAGSWRQDEKARWTWALAVEAADAAHLSFGFDRFNLPEGAALNIYAADGSDRLGPYTVADRLEHGQLWTPVLMADKALIQVTLPAGAKPELDLSLQRVAHGYRGFGVKSKACKSGSCNTDVACLSSGDAWNQPRRSAGLIIIGGTGACSGSLLNNTANDRRMLFATASHCRITSNSAAAGSVVYWRYESPTCRIPGSAASGQPVSRSSSRTSQGLRLLAATNSPFSDGSGTADTRSDWTLLELAAPPAGNDFQLYWAGWDRRQPPQTCAAPSSISSTSGLCASIHHPAGDEKRITFVESPLVLGNISSASGVHFRANWDPTPPILANMQPPPSSLPPSVTEPGSSGSPLFNADRRVVGVLSGGASFCGVGSAGLNDEYGGLFHAWDGLGSASTRMRDHLDPRGTAPLALDGLDSLSSIAVTLDGPAFTTPPDSGAEIRLTANASGGSAPYTFDWDVDGDGTFERTGSGNVEQVTVPRGGAFQVRVQARDSTGATGSTQRALTVRGPQIAASSGGAATQICGDGDANIDPGERWNLPVRLQNNGDGALGGGRALFAANASAGGALEIGPNSFGYAGTANAGSCPYSFVDIASGANAVPALSTAVFDGNGFGPNDDARTADPITLGGQGVLLYGQRYTTAFMSTNGYVSFNSTETGGAFANSCGTGFFSGSSGPQLRVLHDDLVVGSGGGLRYRYFATCPRPAQAGGAQPCHVFQWNGMQSYAGGTPTGNFAFQAIAYEQSGQVTYQYVNADPLNGAEATLGLIDAAGNDPFNFACNASGSVTAQRAYCGYAPSAQPEIRQALRLPQAAVALPGLAVGQSQTVNVPVEIAADAACGSALRLDYVASADLLRGSFALNTAFDGAVASSCNVVTSCPASAPPVAEPRRGLYFNPLRPGNGLNGYFYDIGGGEQFFGGLWYTGLADATSAWYLVAGSVRGQGGEVPLTRVSNAAAPSGFATQSQSVGRAWVAQLDGDSLMLAWQFNDGRSGVELMDATQGFSFASNNHTQAWFNPAEEGWGLAIESLDVGSTDFEFFAAYIFDASGAPRWVVGDKPSTASGNVPLFDFRIHCPGCPWYTDSQEKLQPAGSLDIQYSARNRATLSTSITLPAPLNGSWTRNQTPIQPIEDPRP
ncbi:PKD domain-containing protein [Pseudomarimonas salicorniae]|uniref:PKD domain-containing protein n=1 Tax=Pseudomarimonas salicorniae TaxID=2933270 RepID=A0ABT0GEA4_9GAMM|nr:PKD domain-containing protein [Lysobacter sp. CAU 1642]MCK7592335.1 PKD domain-containing protein [Lysobacter sp. CAU 1642]